MGEEYFEPLIYNHEQAVEFFRTVFEKDGVLPPDVDKCISALQKHYVEIPPNTHLSEANISPFIGSIKVDDISETIERIESNGGRLFMEPTQFLDKINGYQCFVCDPYGNLFSLFQPTNNVNG